MEVLESAASPPEQFKCPGWRLPWGCAWVKELRFIPEELQGLSCLSPLCLGEHGVPALGPVPIPRGQPGSAQGLEGYLQPRDREGLLGFGIVLPLPPDRAQTWAGHVSPEPSPLQEKSWLGSQDLQFSHPNNVSARKRAVSRATAMPRSSEPRMPRVCWDGIRDPSGSALGWDGLRGGGGRADGGGSGGSPEAADAPRASPRCSTAI